MAGMATTSNHFTVPTDEWAGAAKRTLLQGCLIHKPSGTIFVHQADDVPGQAEQNVVIRACEPLPGCDYLGAVTAEEVGHGSTVGLYSTGDTTCEFWLGSEKHGCVVRIAYTIGDRGVKTPTRTVIPKGDVSIDKSEDLLCLRNGNRYRGYRLSAARAGRVELLWEFTIPAWGKRFQGHLVVDGRLFVHRDIATGQESRVHAFTYPDGKSAALFPKVGGKPTERQSWVDTTELGDEAEGCVEIDATLAERFGLIPGVYAGKRTGGTGPSRVFEATRLPIVVTPAAPKRLTGVDVSSYQAGWAPDPADSFVFVKSTEGSSYVNPERARQLDAARRADMLVGHYHFMLPGNAEGQAAWFVANTDVRPGEPLWCDWENTPQGHPSVEDAAAFIAEVKRLVPTSRVGLYCSRSDWMSTTVKAGDGLWVAEYGVDAPATGGTGWLFWQWTDKPLDRNRAKFTSRAELDAWAKVVVPTPPARPPVVVTEPPPDVPAPVNVGVWAVDPGKVQTVLLGRSAAGKTGNALSPGTTIADGLQFVKNSVGRYALLRADGWSYDRDYLVQVGVGPRPAGRQFPVIPDYDTDERIPWRGGLVCRCLAISLPWVEFAMLEAGIIKWNLDFYQLCYRTNVAASAASHAKGMMIDTGQDSDAALRVWRQFGYMMQRREVSQGFSARHGHGGPKGCRHGSTSGPSNAASQASAWERGRDGLRQNRPITGPEPRGRLLQRWDVALAAYLRTVGAPPVVIK